MSESTVDVIEIEYMLYIEPSARTRTHGKAIAEPKELVNEGVDSG